ncbi:hypothetical protein LLG96_11275 [bacterium]|nr:hypothetical protein [bacterium]
MNRRDFCRCMPLTIPCLMVGSHALSAQGSFAFGADRLPGEPLALVYPRRIREMLTRVRETQSGNILEAAYAIARTVEKGNRVWCYWDQGHTYRSDIFPGRDGEPEILTPGYDPKQAKKGDIVLVDYPMSPELIADIAAKDLFVVGGPSPWSGDMLYGLEWVTPEAKRIRLRPVADIWIETYIDAIGAQVKIPGSSAPLGPESGPLSTSIFWMMIADACRILAVDGKPVKVKGDEPKPGDKTDRASLSAPLMDDYFDEIIRELEMVAAELGSIRNMAGIAVDTLLGGGNVYVYSRYREALASEATGRRGGFAFAKNLTDEKITGTSKDCVIVGTYKPDDEADLKNLDAMKSLGMRTMSIGPVTRGFRIPDGRIVARETEAHAGRMADTYGLFAIPGFERRVCPTSGVMVTTILWTLSAEIADQIITRTGDAPAIYFNGALTWDARWDEQMRALADTRGY